MIAPAPGTDHAPTALRTRLLKAGYSPLPIMGKRPPFDSWQNKHDTNPGEIALWESLYKNAQSTGFLTRTTPTLDIDITDPDAAEAVGELVRDRFEERGYILTRIGNAPKRAIPFRTNDAFKKITINLIAANGSEQKIEMLADGQQVVGFGIHPDTNKPYTWHGGEPGAIAHDDLPYIDETTARRLLDDIGNLLVRGYGYQLATARPRKSNGEDDARTGAADWNYLIENIRTGRELHDTTRDVAAKLVASGTKGGAAVNILRGLMETTNAPHDERWQQRYDDIPRLVRSAEDKLAESKPKRTAEHATKGNGKEVHSWDDPDISLLDDRRGDLPKFPLRVFSVRLQQVIKRNAKGAGVTPAHVAVPLIGITSGIIGFARRIMATGSWLQPMTCWTVLVGYSGTGKTPGLNVTKRAVRQIERLGRENELKRQCEHETKKAKAKALYDKWKAEVEEAVENGTPAPQMPPEAVDPGKYIPVRLAVADGTVERLAELLQARPHGIVLLRDELSALFMNMSRYSGGQDDEFWLEAWNGDHYNVERMNRTLALDHLLIGMVGGMQPDKLVKSFEGDHDGKYSRVLFAWPDEPTWQGLNNEADEIDADIQNILSRVNRLAEYADGHLVKLVAPLDAEATEEFAQFAQFAQREKNAFEGREREWFAKATAHVLRLAGTITYLEWGLTLDLNKPDAITKATISAAITLVMDYFWPHARACLRQIGLTEKHANARRTLLWMRAKGKQEVSREDIRRDALSQRLDAKETTDLLTSLCGSGWLREEITPAGPLGGKPVRRWLANPILLKHPVAQTALTAETHP
jgi:hypothetical protein